MWPYQVTRCDEWAMITIQAGSYGLRPGPDDLAGSGGVDRRVHRVRDVDPAMEVGAVAVRRLRPEPGAAELLGDPAGHRPARASRCSRTGCRPWRCAAATSLAIRASSFFSAATCAARAAASLALFDASWRSWRSAGRAGRRSGPPSRPAACAPRQARASCWSSWSPSTRPRGRAAGTSGPGAICTFCCRTVRTCWSCWIWSTRSLSCWAKSR